METNKSQWKYLCNFYYNHYKSNMHEFLFRVVRLRLTTFQLEVKLQLNVVLCFKVYNVFVNKLLVHRMFSASVLCFCSLMVSCSESHVYLPFRNEDIHPFCIQASRGLPVTDCTRNRRSVAICNLSKFTTSLPLEYQVLK